jgi:hypothetical protein
LKRNNNKIFEERSMKNIYYFLLVLLLSSNLCMSAPPDSLIEQTLNLFDLEPYKGEKSYPNLRMGLYSSQVLFDSTSDIFKKFKIEKGYKIWHIIPHTSADEAGLFIGDTLIKLDGKPIYDSKAIGDDYMDLYLYDKKADDTVTITALKNGNPTEFPVKLIAIKTYPMPYKDPGLGEVKPNSWLQQKIDEFKLNGWADTIKKQMAEASISDYNKVPFSDKPNPWRLNAVTYLHRYPLRVGAYSRFIVDDLWKSYDSKDEAFPSIIQTIAKYLDIVQPDFNLPPKPASIQELDNYLNNVQDKIDIAYKQVKDSLPQITIELAKLLQIENNYDASFDSAKNEIEKKKLRNVYEQQIANLFRNSLKVDMTSMVEAARILSNLIDKSWVQTFISALPPKQDNMKTIIVPGVEGEVLYYWTNKQGRCVIGGKGTNHYTGDFSFILDLGGNDIYELPPAKTGSYRFVCDVEGDDTYLSKTGEGSGIGCVDVLFDINGNDTYRAENFSQGAGLLGIGILADFNGDDLYYSHWCSQGAAFLGIGLLFDASGNDNYVADVYSQGFGYTKGFGILMERDGNDSYKAGWKIPDSRDPKRAHLSMSQGFGFGMRPWSLGIGADGGIGVLTDYNGDDVYNADFFSQGGSYWYSLGILYDRKGCDRYTAGQYSQGSGIHLSFGALLDDEGNDMYDAYAGLEQGNSHDWSSGCLEDLEGDDTYRGYSSSQGSALTVAFAYLYDKQGDDMYIIKNTDTTYSEGGGRLQPTRKGGSLGILLDLGKGNDVYTDPRIIEGIPLLKGGKGIVFDDGKK